jgi:hypothetical protein
MRFIKITILTMILGLGAALPVSAADVTLKLSSHLTITLPDWISYAALAPKGVERSPDNAMRSVADGLILQGETQAEKLNATVAIHRGTAYLGDFPDPTFPGFPLERVGTTLEKRALNRIAGGKIERIALTKNDTPFGAVVDHEFKVLSESAPEESIHRHNIFLFYGDGRSAVLEISYPVGREGDWDEAMKAISISFQPMP